jgi:hypothetical protein
MEEVQHAKLDTLMVETLAVGRNDRQIMNAVEEYVEIARFIDNGLGQQVEFDMESLQTATGGSLSTAERESFRRVQRQANRWTYLGTGMTHEKVLETLEALSPQARKHVESISPAFCWDCAE